MASFNVIIRVVIVSALLTTIALVAGQTNGYCNLVWNDEFTGTELDSTKWNKEITCNGGGNGELQCYTPRPQNIFIRNGSLVLKVLRETYTGTQQGCTDNQGCTNTKDFTSGRVNSAGKGSFLYGRMEVRAKLVNGRALWPAIWMLPTDYAYGGWAASGEIDIMEMKGEHPNIVSSTLHHGGAWPNNMWTTTGDKDMAVDLSQDWHTYGCEWNASTIVWFVDKRVTDVFNLNRSWYSGKGPNPYTQNGQPWDKRFHFVFNVAVGGNFFGANYPPPSDAEAAAWKVPEMNIDYVRVWQQGGDCSKDPFASTATTSTGTTSTQSTSSRSPISSQTSQTLPTESTPTDTDENPDEIGEGGSDSTWLSKNAIIVFPAVFGGLLVIGAAILGVALYFKLRRRFEISPGLQTQPSNTQIVTIFPGSP